MTDDTNRDPRVKNPEDRRVNLTFAQKMQVYNRLAEVLTKLEDGTVEYPDRMTDKTIAEELGFATANNVAAIRKSEFGQIAPPQRNVPSGTRGRVIELEAKIADLVKRVEGLEYRERTAAFHVGDAAAKLNGVGKVTNLTDVANAILIHMRQAKDATYSAPSLSKLLGLNNADVIEAIRSLKSSGLVNVASSGDITLRG